MHRTLASLLPILLLACGGSTETPATELDDAAAVDAPVGPTLGGACSVPGALACQGTAQKLQLLCDGAKWVSNGVCAGDLICDPRPGPTAGSCQSPACKAGTTRCDGAGLLKCGADLLTETRTDCLTEEHCKQAVGGICAQCLAWEAKCDGAVLLRCFGARQKLTPKDTCATPELCDAASATCRTPACDAGAFRCTGDNLEQCNVGRTAFEPVKVCPADLCDAAGRECDECKVGAADCVGDTPRSCDATGHWKPLAACSGSTPLCKAGACTAAACAVGEYRCNVNNLEVCNSTRTAFDPVLTCLPGLCDLVGKECDECTSGAADCVGNTPRACDSTGHWKALATCSGTTPLCKSGVCSAGVCSSGEMRCSGDTLERCNSAFTGFEVVKVCGPGLCDGVSKECDDCASGDKSCLGATPRTCDTTGHWTSLAACTGSTPGCSAGTCVSCSTGQVIVDIPFSSVTGWSSTGCCTEPNYMVAPGSGATLVASFTDSIPTGSVPKTITVKMGIEHACSPAANAFEFKFNGSTIGTWTSTKGPDCACGTPAVGDASFAAPTSTYKSGTTNTVSVVHNDSGSCHEAITTVPGTAATTAVRVVIDYGCP